MSRPRAVLFDNDGLLLNTEDVWTRGEQLLFEARGLEFTDDHKRELIGQSAEHAGRLLEMRLGEPAADLIAELDALVLAELDNGVEAMVGATELLMTLREHGIPIGLVSNSPRRFIEKAIDAVGYAPHFDVVVSAHEVARPKPAPDPYLEACRLLDQPPGLDVFAFEDSPSGVAAAAAAGLTVFGIPSFDGVTLEEAHHLAETLIDPHVLEHLGVA
jgi:HAD superfamily hydrolase (TIGR01509 family)